MQSAWADWPFPKNQISVGYYNRHFLYLDVPHAFSPIFWSATTKIDNGGTLMYQHLLFHNRKRFSLYLGADVSRWVRHPDILYAASLFFSIRYWFFRTSNVDMYLSYSVAGPSMMSRRMLGKKDLGGYFIFQDYIGLGLQWGRQHAFNFDARLVHYSNGDIFPFNPGFDVPIVLYLGYSF